MKKRFDPFSLIMGILALVLAYLVLQNPVGSLAGVAMLAGIFLIFDGVMRFVGRNALRSAGMTHTGLITFVAILDVLVGLFALFNPAFGATFVWIFVSITLFMDSLMALWSAKFFRNAGKGTYWLIVILAIIGLLIALAMMFNPVFGAAMIVSFLAAYLVVYGIMAIVQAF